MPASIDFRAALLRAVTVVLCLAFVAGCTMIRLGYGQLDTVASWKANDYFDLNVDQRQEFSQRFDRLHEWHRIEQLPDYVAFLGATQTRLKKGVTRDDVLWVMEGVKARYRTLVRKGADDAAAMLMTVTPAQIETLKKQWDKDNQRFVREYRLKEGPRERHQASMKRLYSRIDDWTGSLSPEQERRIEALVGDAPFIHQLRYEDRLRRQREFLKLMASRGSDKQAFAERLRHFLSNWEEGRNPEYDRLYKDWEQRQADLYVAVEKMLTPHQRAVAMHRLQSYIDDFTRLSQRPGGKAAAAASNG
ncbi:MAG TPA: DUF6279 family lipoprotein [Burkholderiales bacterium]|nr:DUF6279 family lipoprotein [Burkholderiales bacterium]